MLKGVLPVFALSLLLLPMGGALAQERLRVMVSIAPLAYFAERIGGEGVEVSVMVPPGANPHVYEPLPGQLRRLSATDLYIKVGSGLEFERAWMDKLAALNTRMRVCDASRGIALAAGDHGAYDPHIWTSPANALVICASIRDCLVEMDPARRAAYVSNAARLNAELEQLQQEIRLKLKDLSNRKFFIYHPAWGYFAREFGMEEIAVEQLGKEPTPRQLAALIRQARAAGVNAVLVAPQFSERSAMTVAKEINGRVARVDALAKDLPGSLRALADVLGGH